MTSPELVAQLARQVFGASELQLIGRGELAEAGRRAAHKGGCSRGFRWQVEGQHLGYIVDGVEGRVPLRTLAEWAAGRMTARAAEELGRRYNAYVQAATVPYTLNQADPAYQADPDGMWARANAATAAARALDEAARACLADEPDTPRVVDGGLFPEPPRQRRCLVGAGTR